MNSDLKNRTQLIFLRHRIVGAQHSRMHRDTARSFTWSTQYRLKWMAGGGVIILEIYGRPLSVLVSCVAVLRRSVLLVGGWLVEVGRRWQTNYHFGGGQWWVSNKPLTQFSRYFGFGRTKQRRWWWWGWVVDTVKSPHRSAYLLLRQEAQIDKWPCGV